MLPLFIQVQMMDMSSHYVRRGKSAAPEVQMCSSPAVFVDADEVSTMYHATSALMDMSSHYVRRCKTQLPQPSS